MISRPVLPLAWTLVGSVVIFSTLALGVAAGGLVPVDLAIANWLHATATGLGSGTLGAVTELGGSQALLAVTVSATLWLLLRRRVAHAALMVAALAGGELLNAALKGVFERPRPSFSDPLATAAGFSFPSGHAMVSLTVYGALAFVLAASMGGRRGRVLVLATALALVLAIGFSRVYLGVHYASDVLAAYSAGLAWLTLCGLTLLGTARLRVPRTSPRRSSRGPGRPHSAGPRPHPTAASVLRSRAM
jgi:membrane-associated phospholipid phosphatase